MSGLIILAVMFIAFAVLDILAQAFGADSRPDFEESHSGGLTV